MKNREAVLNKLRRRGIVVTSVGPYTNFRNPEGRVIKLSEEKTIRELGGGGGRAVER